MVPLVKNLPANAGDSGCSGSILESGRSLGVGNGNPLQSQIINAGESVETREPSYTVGGNVNWCSHFMLENSMEIL